MNSSTNDYAHSYVQNNTSSEELFVEVNSPLVKSMYLTVGLISALSSSLAVCILRRTKRIPHSAKFLSTGLMIFDFMFISSSTARKFIQDPIYNTALNVFSNTFIILAYTTVGIMAFERFLLFYQPMSYMRICTKTKTRYITITTWTVIVILFYSVRYGMCYMKFKTPYVFYKAGLCNQIVIIYYSGIVLVVLTSAIFSYCNIFRMVKNQATVDGKNLSYKSTASLLRTYRSTSLILVFFVVILSTSIAYVCILVYIRNAGIDVSQIRHLLESVSIVNCILDPFLYVLWFQESRMELLKMLPFQNRAFKRKAEKMRYEVFNIVISDSSLVNSKLESVK